MSTPAVPRCPTCGQPVPPRKECTCGHGHAVHDIARNGERTACYVVTQKGRCPCRKYVRAEVPDGT